MIPSNISLSKSFSSFVVIISLLLVSNSLYSQGRKKTNWLQDKKANITRWRIGVGIHAGEPTGAHVQFYKLSGICTKTIRIKKMFTLDLSVSQEGYLFGEAYQSQISGWEKGGLRANVDAKIYFPIMFNPYLGVGGETGTRQINGDKIFSSDIVGRIGIEQKVLGIRTSPNSIVHAGLFIEGKYNYGLTHKINVLLPTIGLRVHFI